MSLMLAVLLLAADPTTAPIEPAVKPEKASRKTICKVDPANTGSRMKKRMCLTAAEWDLRAQGKNAGDLKTLGAR
jgi:hypothetical protein